jgi:hypothetical protein
MIWRAFGALPTDYDLLQSDQQLLPSLAEDDLALRLFRDIAATASTVAWW